MKLLAERNKIHRQILSHGAVHDWDMAISEHLYSVNTRNGWGLSRQPSAWDRWVPWAMAVMTLGVAVMGWLRGWL